MPKPRPKKNKRLRIVAVHWVDATYQLEGGTDLEPVHALTFGYLVEEGEKYVKIASEIFEDGMTRQVTAVPRGMVTEIIYNPTRLPEEFDGWKIHMEE